jgi:hypothetical protein
VSEAAPPRSAAARADWPAALGLGLLAALGYFAASRLVDPRLAQPPTSNVWFDSDIPYRLEVMLHPGGWHNGGAHPLFPTLGHWAIATAQTLTRESDPMRAAGSAGAAVGGVFVALLYLLLRKLDLRRPDAALFAAIGAASSGALLWFPVPESYGLAAAGVTLALLVAASTAPSAMSLVVACVASGATILTNGCVGFLTVAFHHRNPRLWGRALLLLVAALGAMSAVWLVQEWSFDTPYFLSHRLLEYRQHTFPVTLERTAQVVQGLLVHSVVAPGLLNDRPSFRHMAIMTSGIAGVVATLSWLALLALGAVGTARAVRGRGEHAPVASVAAAALALAFAMHLTLGRELVLYALDVLPLLVVIAALSLRVPRAARLARSLALLLLVAMLAANLRQLVRATDAARTLVDARLSGSAASSEGR